MIFDHTSVRENLFLSARFGWDSMLSLVETDQNFEIGGAIGHGDSYLEFLFRQFNFFKLHAMLHDAAGAVRARSCKDPGYCYMIGRGQNSRLLGNVTGILF